MLISSRIGATQTNPRDERLENALVALLMRWSAGRTLSSRSEVRQFGSPLPEPQGLSGNLSRAGPKEVGSR